LGLEHNDLGFDLEDGIMELLLQDLSPAPGQPATAALAILCGDGVLPPNTCGCDLHFVASGADCGTRQDQPSNLAAAPGVTAHSAP
jgi:hypothetical protein